MNTTFDIDAYNRKCRSDDRVYETTYRPSLRRPVLLLLLMAFVFLAGYASAQGVSETRNFARSGPYNSQWSDPAVGANTDRHQGRGPGTFEDAGKGRITFDVKADSKGNARIAVQDVGDTKNFKHLTLNGKKIDVPAPRKNGGWSYVNLSGLKAAWNTVTLRTHLKPGLPKTRQDGFGVKTCK